MDGRELAKHTDVQKFIGVEGGGISQWPIKVTLFDSNEGDEHLPLHVLLSVPEALALRDNLTKALNNAGWED